MKPYTLIYSDVKVTKMQRVITNDLSKVLKLPIYSCNCWMVFEGHPILEGETEISPVAILTYKYSEK
jgi:hypothetical protein